MEVGAVKHALNNEIIHIKKKLNQAKIQLINKLTRKAKTLKTKKEPPEHLKEKLQRKADAAVAEVLLIKKVQAKDLVRFAIDHKGNLKDYLNKPKVDNEKVYAKILLHKSLMEKYNAIRASFANMPVDELLMTRKERLKLKKERKEAMEQKDKKGKASKAKKPKILEEKIDEDTHSKGNDNKEDESCNDDDDEENVSVIHSDEQSNDENSSDEMQDLQDDTGNNSESNESSEESHTANIGHLKIEPIQIEHKKPLVKKVKTKKQTKKPNQRDRNKDKVIETAPAQAKVIDSFFLTASGDNYMTLAEPRQPDEVKEVHQRGNRKMRRAEMFGKPIKFNKPYRNNREIGQKSSFENDSTSKYAKPTSSKNYSSFDSKDKRTDVLSNDLDKRKAEAPVEKLHPSWEAKKLKSGIVAFQGKKVVF